MENDFNDFWTSYEPDEIRFPNRRAATYLVWQRRSAAARKAMLDYVKDRGAPKWKNPYFFVIDFPEPKQQILSYADYYNRYGTTEEKDGWKRTFLPEQQKTIYIKNN